MALCTVLGKLSYCKKLKESIGYDIEELEKLQKIILKHYFCSLELEEIHELWNKISDDRCAQWLSVSSYSDEEIIEMIDNLM
jgi:hypothetical protein